MDMLSLAQEKTQLRKTAGTHGGEFVGPCPGCGGRDRFHVWPDRTDSRRSERVGIYWCRGCGKGGDVVQFLVDFDGKSYPEAFAALGLEAPAGGGRHVYAAPRLPVAAPPAAPAAPAPAPEKSAPPPDLWQQKALALVEHAEKALAENDYILKWLKKRGISRKTAAGMRLGWLSEDRWRSRASWGLPRELKADGSEKKLWIPAGLVIPLLEASGPEGAAAVRRIRIRRFSDQEPRYYNMPGSSMACRAHGLPNRAAVIVENDLDAIMIAGQAADLAAVVAMGTSKAKPGPALTQLLAECAVILVALDYGDGDLSGGKGWTWWRQAFPQARRWPVLSGKDAGEAYAAGADIRAWILAGLPPGWRTGPSPIGLVTGRREECVLDERENPPGVRGAAEGEPAGVEAAAREPGDDAGGQELGAVAELAQLLRRHPVEIRVAAGGSRVWIRENHDWKRKNWETARRISQLVFMDCEVLDYLLGHGEEIINGKNILKGT
jgi:hypothetical protein